MKKTLLHSIFALGLAAGCLCLTSCEDFFGNFLDKQPSSELTEEEVFSDWNLMKEFHFDTYNFLLNGACRVNSSWLDTASDLGETSYSSGGTRQSFNMGNYYSENATDELTSVWESRYRGIRKCNQLLANIESVPQDASLSDETYQSDKTYYKAEARFLRAWFYWELFLRYGPVPIVTDVLDPNGDLLTGYTTRPTIREYVVDFILSELDAIKDDLLDYSTAWVSSRAGRIAQPMAYALMSRIKLYMASDRFSADSGVTWQEAADAAKLFMDMFGANFWLFSNEGDDAISDYTNALLRTAYSGNNTETIFYRNDVVIGWAGIQNDTPVGEGGNGGCCPSQNLVDMYDMADGSSPFTEYDETGAPVYDSATYAPTGINSASGYDDSKMWENRDPRFYATVLYHGVDWGNGTINVILGQRDNPVGNTNSTPTGYYMRKYIPETILAAEHTQTAYRLWTIIRYAEILLNYAEALNEVQGPCQEVYDALDLVRQRGGITGSVADRTDLTDQSSMRNFIRKERTVELCFEEHRWWDVRRWNVADKALSRPIYGIEVADDGTVTRKLAQKRVFEDRMYLYPIPESEEWKTNIENNPGW